MAKEVEIIGGGLAGCCLAWQLRRRGVAVSLVDVPRPGAASPVAAGLVNPVTGRNFEPSGRIAEFLPEAVAFFDAVGAELGRRFWFPLPVLRLVAERDWPKVARKLERPEVAAWVERVDEELDDWRAGVWLRGGGRVDVRGFCEATREHFGVTARPSGGGRLVRCGGFSDLTSGLLGEHRCAKGEILTIHLPAGDESRIVVGGGGWLVPLGGGLFKAGATYEWEQLDGRPTERGRARIEEILRTLGVTDFTVVAHEAGVRPIVRRSLPLVGERDGELVFNGLGSKGSLYAPGVARRMAEWMIDGRPLDPEWDLRFFRGGE